MLLWLLVLEKAITSVLRNRDRLFEVLGVVSLYLDIS